MSVKCYAESMPRWTVGVCVLATLCVATPATQVPSTVAAPAVASAATLVKHFLWTVTAPDAPTSYLMGALHVLTPEYYPLSPRIEQAFAASKVLIEEADLDELNDPATTKGLMGKAMLTDGRTLEQLIPGDLFAKVMERADKLGLPRMAVQRMKPWLVAISLTAPTLQAAGFKPEHGVDKHFFDRAKKSGMPHRALETLAFQFDRLDQLSPVLQEALLRSTIEEIDAQVSSIKSMAEAWSRGDVAAIEKLVPAATAPELHQRLLVERNAAWVSAVDDCVKQQTPCFIVVGAAHLVGPDSLVAMLQKKGYKVEQQ